MIRVPDRVTISYDGMANPHGTSQLPVDQFSQTYSMDTMKTTPVQTQSLDHYANTRTYEDMMKVVNEDTQNLEQQCLKLQQELDEIKTKHSETIRTLEDHLTNLERRRIESESDNVSLRKYIANMKIAQAPGHDDAYYIDKLQGLNRLIESTVAAIFVDPRRQRVLSKEDGLEFLAALTKFTPFGSNTAKLLKTENFDTIWSLHEEARKRVAIARHIVMLFLWEHVFTPFAFGLSEERSTMLRHIESYLLANGNVISKSKLIHRAGVFQSFDDPPNFGKSSSKSN